MDNKNKNILLIIIIMVVILGFYVGYSYLEVDTSENNNPVQEDQDITDDKNEENSSKDEENEDDKDIDKDDSSDTDDLVDVEDPEDSADTSDENLEDNTDSNEPVNPEEDQTSKNYNVSNVDEMLKQLNLKNGDTVTTDEYHFSTNQGGATYKIVDKTSMDVDNGKCFKLDNGLYAVFSSDNEKINVNQYGAYGDGIHDDSKAISSMLENNDIVNLMNETYLIESSIEINNSNKQIIGNNSSILLSNDSYFITLNDVYNVAISDVTFINENNNSTYKSFVKVEDSSNILFKNNEITFTAEDTFINNEGSTNITMTGNTIEYNINNDRLNNFSVFEGNISDINNNSITINALNNNLTVDIFDLNGNNLIYNNNININVNTSNVFNNIESMNTNIINIYNKTNNVLTWTNDLATDIIINNNTINNYYNEETANVSSSLFMMSNIKLNNNNVDFKNNVINGNDVNSNSKLILFDVLDDTSQVLNFLSNEIHGYEKRYIIGSDDHDISMTPKEDVLFASVDSMVNSSSLNEKDIVKTTGYYNNSTLGSSYYTIVDSVDISYSPSEVIPLNSGKYAVLFNTGSPVSVNQFGAYGDGVNGDSIAIVNAFKSGYDSIYLETGTYYLNEKLDLINISGVQFDGKNNLMYLDDNFTNTVDNNSEFAILVHKSSYIDFINLNMEATLIEKNKVKTQLGIRYSDYISIKDSRFYIGEGKAFNNIDLWTNWTNITIDNNVIIQETDVVGEGILGEGGGNIWIRDIGNDGSENLKFTNNKCFKSSHDEMLAVFMGSIENVHIANNEFDSEVRDARPSIMNFTLGSSDQVNLSGVVFENNIINTQSSGGLIWSLGNTDTIIRNNTINYTKYPVDGIESFIFKGMVELVENNDVTIKNSDSSVETSTYVFTGNNVRNNTLTTYAPITTAFSNSTHVVENELHAYDSVANIFSGVNNIENNNVTIDSALNNFFHWYGHSITSPINVTNNVINYNYDEITNDKESMLIQINEMNLNDHPVNISDNQVYAPNAKSSNRLLFAVIKDESIQNITIENNFIDVYKNTYVLPSKHNVVLNNNVPTGNGG